MLSVKHAKHVKPAFHPTRSTLSAGLTAVLLPLCLASPALADTVPVPADSAATSTATMEPSPSASPVEQVKQQTVVRMSGPRGTVAPGSHALAVRLLADDRPVKDGYVRIEKWTSTGWAYAGRLLTRADGLASGKLSMTATTKWRAVYQGSTTRTAAQSAALTVTVAKASSTFRQKAVQAAAQQNGKPYRYGSTGPSSFDCSGLIQFAFKQAGKQLPRTSRDMYRVAQKLAKGQQKPGDLIFMSSDGRIGHVGVYAGNGKFWDAPRAGKNVALRPIFSDSYYVGRIN